MARQNETAPDTFIGSEHTTETVRRTAELLGAEQSSTRRGARTSGRNVQRVARVQRGHAGSRAAAVRSQAPLRENLPVTFKPTSDLEAPPAPPGMVRRWVRYKIGDRADPKNITKKFRQGWRPFLAKDAPEGYMPPETSATQYGEAITSGDLMLCLLPAKLQAARDHYYKRQNEKRSATIKDRVREHDDIEVTEKASLTRGKRPRIQSDAE